MSDVNDENRSKDLEPIERRKRDIIRIKDIIQKRKVWTYIKHSNSFVLKNSKYFRAQGYNGYENTNFAYYNDPDMNEKGKHI